MHPLSRLWEKESRLVIGLMSGTSADGIDAALVKISGAGATTRVEMKDFLFVPMTDEVRETILRVAGGKSTTAAEICRLKTLLGLLYAEACEALCAKAGVKKEEIDLVGNHGQTVWHIPVSESYLGREFASTLQIGEDAVIAERLGCPVVGDFRVRDVAAGGQGAPLVPYAEFLLYRDENVHTALQNLGGIGNVTVIPAAGRLEDVVAFDTGPGNMVIDQLVARATGGRMRFDEGGAIAAGARVSPDLLAWMLLDPYLNRKPPKTTGREMYGPEYVDRLMAKAEALGVSIKDAIATATRFTAETIAVGLQRFAPVVPARLIVGGGGCMNRTLMDHLRQVMVGCRVMTNEEMGFSGDAKEAVAFAILANEAIFAACNNVPAVTGAQHPVVMGKISL